MDVLLVTSISLMLFSFISLVVLYTRSQERYLNSIRNKADQLTPMSASKDTPSLFLTREEFYKVLNFMLMFGVITYDEYSKMEIQSLPFLSTKKIKH